ncbi:MAG: 5-oxoprolinase subunit PxpB [Bacillota bacterium]
MFELRLVPCGDRALLCYLGDGIDPAVNDRVHALTRALRRHAHPAVLEVTPGFHTVLVEFDPVRLRTEQAQEMIRKAAAQMSDEPAPGRTVEIPVCYGGEMGPDLEAVAAHTGLSPDEVIQRHAEGQYRVYCLGFSPGFPYLGGLEPELHTPRLAEPRVTVPGGSVGIGGEQTGIYPAPSPGGWRLIGRTPLRLFDPQRPDPALLQPGDRVRFVPVDPVRFGALEARQNQTEPVAPVYHPGRLGVRILQPGMMTTLQDLGRRGFMAYGVPVAGAADFSSLMVGNWLLGNRARTAALEITLTGPEVEFTGPTAFAITGAPIPAELFPADGSHPRPVPGWTTVLASPGDRLRMGATTAGCRSYLCVAGGFDLPPVLGSLSEDLFGKIGPLGRPLKAGDWLPIGLPLQSPADLSGRRLPAEAIPSFEGDLVVRATRGPHLDAFTGEAFAAFFGGEYRVGAHSDRQGLRLEGPKLTHVGGADIISQPVPPGTIQVPANGQPILLMGNRQTTGGYANIGVALYNDLWAAAQLRPGDRIRFQEVDVAEAHQIAWQERRRLGQVRRYLEREIGHQRREPVAEAPARILATAPAEAPAPVGPAVTPPAPTAVRAAPAQAGVRTFRIAIAGIEFVCEVEEVKE